jgi:hypothetical protein
LSGDLTFPDGLELRGHTLYVVGNERVTVVRLGPHLASGVVLGAFTDPTPNLADTDEPVRTDAPSVASRAVAAQPRDMRMVTSTTDGHESVQFWRFVRQM